MSPLGFQKSLADVLISIYSYRRKKKNIPDTITLEKTKSSKKMIHESMGYISTSANPLYEIQKP